jgi:hypothetical protein
MAEYKKVCVDIMENGYTVTILTSNNDTGKKFVFSTAKKLRDWLRNNLSATGEVEEFSKALDCDDRYLSMQNGFQVTRI